MEFEFSLDVKEEKPKPHKKSIFDIKDEEKVDESKITNVHTFNERKQA